MIGSPLRHGDFSALKGQVPGDKEHHEELPHGRSEDDSAGEGEISIHNHPGRDGILGGAKPIRRDEGRHRCRRFPGRDFIGSCGLRVQRQGASIRRSDVGARVGC
jgi:hypothetical protein